MRQGQGPETQVGCSVGNRTQYELNSLNQLVDEEFAERMTFVPVSALTQTFLDQLEEVLWFLTLKAGSELMRSFKTFMLLHVTFNMGHCVQWCVFLNAFVQNVSVSELRWL